MIPGSPESDEISHGGIEAVGLRRRFGARLALDGVDLRVPPRRSTVLFGPNGAGKTTLIRILTLSLRAGDGRFRIEGLDPRRDSREILRRIGLISHQSFLYDDLSARQNLEFYGRLYGVPQPARRAAELLERVGLAHRADEPVGGYSRGMQQRLSLARALVHDPPIVFLDEPFTGLDVQAAQMLRSTLGELRRQGRTVLMVTHNLEQGLELSDQWLILSRGRVVGQGDSASTDPSEFRGEYARCVEAPRRRSLVG